MATPISAAIYGCAGETLTQEEKDFFHKVNPFGFILFARNCRNPEQIKKLTAEMREAVNREPLAILIDQEGGRVARLKPPHWRAAPPAQLFSELAERDIVSASKATYLNGRLIAAELHALGITVNCAPLADIPSSECHDIIGDRAYGSEPERVSTLSRAMAEGLLDGGVLPVLKHIPGHGRATVDSHASLPIVETSLPMLEASDFLPFYALRDLPFGMTAHILYKALDAEKPATLSPQVIRYIRDKIGFDGMLMSDDLSMKALAGDMGLLAKETLQAGCDLVLHCNGDMAEMQQVATGVGALSPQSERRMQRAWAQFHAPVPLDIAQTEAELAELTSKAAA